MNLLAVLMTQSENFITRAISGPIDQWSLTFLAPGSGFVEDNSSIGWRWEMVWGWFKHITFIAHFMSIVITSAPPQISRN